MQQFIVEVYNVKCLVPSPYTHYLRQFSCSLTISLVFLRRQASSHSFFRKLPAVNCLKPSRKVNVSARIRSPRLKKLSCCLSSLSTDEAAGEEMLHHIYCYQSYTLSLILRSSYFADNQHELPENSRFDSTEVPKVAQNSSTMILIFS